MWPRIPCGETNVEVAVQGGKQLSGLLWIRESSRQDLSACGHPDRTDNEPQVKVGGKSVGIWNESAREADGY